MANELETVATFTDLTQAQSARSALESAEIENALQDEATGSLDWGMMPAMGGLRLQVRSADAERAREVLAGLGQPGELARDPEEVEHFEAARRKKRRIGMIAFFFFFLPTLLAVVLSWLD